MVAPGRTALRAHPLLRGRSSPPVDTLWLRPSHGRPGTRAFPVLASLACLAGALQLRPAASAPRAAPPPPSPLTLPLLRRTGGRSAQFLAPGLGRDMWP